MTIYFKFYNSQLYICQNKDTTNNIFNVFIRKINKHYYKLNTT